MHVCCEVFPLIFEWLRSRRTEYQLILAFGEDRDVCLRVCKLGRLNSDQLQVFQQVVERYACIHCDYFNALRFSLSDTPIATMTSAETSLVTTVVDPTQPIGSKPQHRFYSDGTNGVVLRDLAQLLFVYRSGSRTAWRTIPVVFDLYLNPTAKTLATHTLQSLLDKCQNGLRATAFIVEKLSDSMDSKERIAFSISISDVLLPLSSTLSNAIEKSIGRDKDKPTQPPCLVFSRFLDSIQEPRLVGVPTRVELPPRRYQEEHKSGDTQCEEEDTTERSNYHKKYNNLIQVTDPLSQDSEAEED